MQKQVYIEITVEKIAHNLKRNDLEEQIVAALLTSAIRCNLYAQTQKGDRCKNVNSLDNLGLTFELAPFQYRSYLGRDVLSSFWSTMIACIDTSYDKSSTQ